MLPLHLLVRLLLQVHDELLVIEGMSEMLLIRPLDDGVRVSSASLVKIKVVASNGMSHG